MAHADIRIILIGVGVAMFLGALDQTIIAAALPAIAGDLGDFGAISWVASIYLLTATAVTPLYGKFSDIKGRRAALSLGVIVFVAGSVACAMAPSMAWLIAARAVQGLGGGGLISLAQTIVADIVAPKERGKYQIYFASVFLLASLLGPTLGGIVLALWADDLPLWVFEAVLGVISIGLGTVLPTTTVAIQNAGELHQLGTATGTMNFFRQLGSAVTVAIFGALLNATGISEATLHAGAELAHGGFRSIFTATAIGVAIAFAFSRWMKERPLRSSSRQAAEAVIAD